MWSWGAITVNKNDLVAAVASEIDMPKTQVTMALESALAVISKALRNGDDVRLVGFGTFYVKRRAAIKGRDPRTGQPIEIKAARTPKFKAGKVLKEAVG